MPVTELAIIRLAPGVSIANKSFRDKLLRSKEVMENALNLTGRRFVYYQGVEDPQVIYLLGDWQSPEEHWKEFIPSAENQGLLEMLKDDFDIATIEMYHVDTPIVNVPTGTEVMSIGWHRVRAQDKEAFETRFAECKQWLDHYVSQDTKPGGGWRIEKAAGRQEEEEEEWVLFCGWKTVEEHKGFSSTEDFNKYSRIRDFVQEFNVKHGQRIIF